MKTYHLYLDESETHNKGLNKVFSIAGIIVEKTYHDTILNEEMKLLKNKIWSNYSNPENLILHEKEIRFAQNPHNKYNLNFIDPKYRQFKDFAISKKLYTGLEKIIRSEEITIIGSCIVIDNLQKYYHKDILNNKSLIAMQIIVENFCHFLKKNNGVGKIFYESVESEFDKIMSMRFHQIKVFGTTYIAPYYIQKLIHSIEFPNKKDNITGLQIADFIPNDLGRSVLGKNKHKLNLNKEINRSKYDGGINDKNTYGVKIIPNIP